MEFMQNIACKIINVLLKSTISIQIETNNQTNVKPCHMYANPRGFSYHIYIWNKYLYMTPLSHPAVKHEFAPSATSNMTCFYGNEPTAKNLQRARLAKIWTHVLFWAPLASFLLKKPSAMHFSSSMSQ